MLRQRTAGQAAQGSSGAAAHAGVHSRAARGREDAGRRGAARALLREGPGGRGADTGRRRWCCGRGGRRPRARWPAGPPERRREQVLESLAAHVRQNLVRLGKKFFVQRRGIPQGSVVSSLLVSVFYGRLEADVLGWERDAAAASAHAAPDYLLLRLIDDFLLLTTSRARAEAFLRVLHRGMPEFGVTVKPEKSLANFAVCIDGMPVPRCDASTFPLLRPCHRRALAGDPEGERSIERTCGSSAGSGIQRCGRAHR